MKQHSPDPLAYLTEGLALLEGDGLRRRPPQALAAGDVSFCSNDYLGLAGRPSLAGATGAGASRLLAGDHAEHRALERAFATWLDVEDALLFPSGYAANVGAVAALAGPGDLIVSDALNHASLIDGARLSRARVVVVPHGDLEATDRALENRAERTAWVVVESYYSMDADGPDLARLRGICEARRAALLVDEAHAIGVLGPGGRGRCAAAGVRPDVLVAPLGKAFGGQGALLCGRAVVRDWLWNKARSFVFSTGLAPVSAVAARGALDRVVGDPALAARVATLAARFRDGIVRQLTSAGRGAATPLGCELRLLGFGHIVPLLVGPPRATVRLGELLRSRGIAVQAIRPPTVPPGGSRLRMTITALHTEDQIDRALDAFAWALPSLARDAQPGL